ncbi:L-lactate permease [Sphingobium herbicidovorans NBRC 16415]|uniref:L-lactate permease n=1 Tax=Sphingobium herbicidovorans (strain ATCC 700291 / DSM 11019 / CCUG 56400 / KCTC 2939 / LMG 18315 / NBRC 16415 / MH) TaxID=1219045 RepID=A0A086PEW1_SPHHM|nr:L-lactate permease [Sphingobium herbicidovorans]KFG91929.1 L-lactate permease [Sphingobium herbicidovorans NBRC 16415]
MIWAQNYDPLGNGLLSALVAAVPVVVLLGAIGLFHVRAHIAALMGLGAGLAVAVLAFGMPAGLALRAAGFGAAYGLLPIGWIVLNIIFLYQLTETTGQFHVLRGAITSITGDSRLQLLLIAFCFGAFFEGAAGFGTPVAVTGAMLIGLGFTRLQASGLSLIANTAPVAFGALGTPLVTLAGVTGLPLMELSAMVGRQMTPFAIIVPFWLLVAYCGWRRTMEVLPAVLVAGVSFAVVQLLISNLHGPWLTSIGAALASIATLIAFLRIWQPARIMHVNEAKLAAGDERDVAATADAANAQPLHDPAAVRRAWMPWIILTGCVFLWGLPFMKQGLDAIFALRLPFAGLDGVIQRLPPVVSAPEYEKAVYNLNLLSATGTAILVAALASALLLRVPARTVGLVYLRTWKLVLPSLLTIAAMLALGYLTRFGGIDASMGLAFAATGVLYPFFGTMLGWLGVAVTGSDTASNVLFGGLQKITAEQLGLPPVLMAGANSAGGVMGKMIDAQSIVVASTATQWFGQEGRILRHVFVHSVVLGSLIGLFVMLQAYVYPFTLLVP